LLKVDIVGNGVGFIRIRSLYTTSLLPHGNTKLTQTRATYFLARAQHPTHTVSLTNIRLLPLGDSITFGLTSSDGNGYRSTLHNLLQAGNTVDFIGSIKSGTMADNDNEGHSGFTVSQIAQSATNALALPARPNVRLLVVWRQTRC
jgi:hypothetical protein